MSENIRLERRDTELTVIAEWGDAAAEWPRRLVIEAPAISGKTLREVERRLFAMSAELHEMPSVGGFAVMVRQFAENRLAELPEDGPAFHRGLLEIYEKIDTDGHVDAVRTLAAAMRLPEETMRACLRVARQRLSD
ncbi:hypothetical protein [Actinoplanes sp. NPDC049802]|uniref:hypothetical protein n=1 Tax=Actinoplanes sp. NPDC049802 TaxID=3154742 RepID=UPI00340BD701